MSGGLHPANGLNHLNRDSGIPFDSIRSATALVNSLIIFVAAWVGGRRRLMTERIERRKIRVEA
jgi:hypothetical protein